MAKPDSRIAASTTVESAIALGWDIVDRCCRANIDVAERTTINLPSGHAIEWRPAAIGHGDLGMAMVYSAADQLDPDGGWDQLARTHLAKAAHDMQQGPLPTLGLFSGAAALAFAFRAHSRSGQRYQRATADIDALIARELNAAAENVNPEEGSATAIYDVVSGLTGAISYAFTTEAGTGKLGDSALRAIGVLAQLALTDRPGGLWTSSAKMNVFEHAKYDECFLDCGFAHGIVGVLNVLGQACDRGWGSPLVAEATEHLAELLLEASVLDGVLDVPYALVPGEARGATQSRYAWCYGNLGAAVPFHNSETLRRSYPDVVARLLDTSTRTYADQQLGGPGLCHGRAGKLVLERIMLGEQTVSVNAESILRLCNRDRTFLLTDFIGDVQVDSPGFLDGSGGAAAALLSLQTDSEAMSFVRMLTGTWIHS